MCSFNKLYLKWFRSDPFTAIFDFREVRSCLTVESFLWLCYKVMEKLRLSLCQQRELDQAITICDLTLAQEYYCLQTRGFFQLTKEGLICLFITRWFTANITRILHTLVYWLTPIYELCWWPCVITNILCCLKLSAQGYSACIIWHHNITVAIIVLTAVKSGWGKS